MIKAFSLLLLLFTLTGAIEEPASKIQESNVQLTLEQYTQLYKEAFLANMSANAELTNTAADVTKLKEQERALKEKHDVEIEMLRRRYSKRWLQSNVKQSKPDWLTEDGVDLSGSKRNNWMPLHSKISGSWNHSSRPSSPAVFDFEIYFRIFTKKWTVIPLLHAGTVVSNWEVEFSKAEDTETDTLLEMIDKDLYTLDVTNPFGDMTLVEKERDRLNDVLATKIAGWKGWSSSDPSPGTQSEGTTSIYQDVKSAVFTKCKSTEVILLTAPYSEKEKDPQPTHVLSAINPGLYRVKFSAYTAVRSLSKIKQDSYSLSLSNLFFPVTELDLKVMHNTSSGEGVHDFSSTPSGYHKISRVADGEVIRINVPVTQEIDMKWRNSIPPPPEPEIDSSQRESANKTKKHQQQQQQQPLAQATVRHDALHSVEEGNLLQSTHFVKYNLDTEQASLTDTTIRIYPSKSRVTSVIGHGLSTWNYRQGGSNDSYSLLSLSFNSGIADTIMVQIGVELEFSDDASEKQHLAIPKIVCENVIRQTGYYGITKASNIELHQKVLPRGITRVSIKDLSEPMRFKASSGPPLVLAYKYLSTSALVNDKKKAADPELILTVKAHEQMAILDAIVENAFYKETVMENGRSVHKLLLIVQNTKEQYLRLHNLPSSMKVWSLNVNSVGVKPVLIGDHTSKSSKSILIPLLVGLPSDLANRKPPKTSVEIVYASENDFLTRKTDSSSRTSAHHSEDVSSEDDVIRTMSLTPPLVEALPIEHLSVLINFPEGYNTVFSSQNMKKLGGVPEELSNFVRNNKMEGTGADIIGPLKRGFTKKLPSPISHKKGKIVVPKEYKFGEHDGAGPGDDASEGLSIEFEDVGTAHRFQRALLEDELVKLSVAYQQTREKKPPPPPTPSWWESAIASVAAVLYSTSP
eukprot:TRINITY_DN1712_c0_g2_i2.p1 TRINITY_DN1712_c0_g2~~TRINITY_DN1712_c0_g2_i2.p1  ORF type:complete len:916 (+),score=182.90 TRINITY_DN1712_c0_g2_i2:49-2796(+)